MESSISELKPEKPLNLHQRMLAVTRDCKKAKEDGKVRGGKISYDFTSHNAVTELVQPVLVLHGVDASPVLLRLERDIFEVQAYKAGDPPFIKNRSTVYFQIRYVNVDDPKDVEVQDWFAESIGNDDKQVGIAISAGIRQAYQKRFKLRSGDPDIEDGDNEHDKTWKNPLKKVDKNPAKDQKEKKPEQKRKDSGGEPFDAKTHNRLLLSAGKKSMFTALVEKYDWHSLELVEQIFSGYGVDTTDELFDSDWTEIKAKLEKGPQATDIPF